MLTHMYLKNVPQVTYMSLRHLLFYKRQEAKLKLWEAIDVIKRNCRVNNREGIGIFFYIIR